VARRFHSLQAHSMPHSVVEFQRRIPNVEFHRIPFPMIVFSPPTNRFLSSIDADISGKEEVGAVPRKKYSTFQFG